jgi:hypothetical protein
MLWKMPLHGYHLVNAAITLPEGGNFLPLCRRPMAVFRKATHAKAADFRAFSTFFKKIDAAPKSFFPPAVIPFRGRKQPDGSDLIVNGKGLS